jgi:hypothetical protein
MVDSWDYCKLFVRGAGASPGMIASVLAQALGALEDGRYVKSPVVQACVDDNDEFVSYHRDFLFWPFIVDVEATVGSTSEAFVRAAETAMSALAGAGCEVVAACDFEHLLPGAGRLP